MLLTIKVDYFIRLCYF